MSRTLGLNDAVLLVSLSYSSFDLSLEWESFRSCSRPIHRWLLVSYAFVVALRLMHLLGTHFASSAPSHNLDGGGAPMAEDFLLDLRHKSVLPRLLVRFTWMVALPFFILWTYVGTIWLWDVTQHTPACVPNREQLYFAVFWLFLCYAWIAIHCGVGGVAWILERRVRRAERALRAVEDEDVLSRWGQVSQLSGYHALHGPAASQGLTPEDLSALECERCAESAGEPHECSICICQVEVGEAVRRLPGCGHVFHKSCIDLWLLRRADCPLCKCETKVRSVHDV